MKIKLQKRQLLAIGVGFLVYFAGQVVLGFLLVALLALLSQTGSQKVGSIILVGYNLLQLAIVILAGGVVGWLVREKGLVWGTVLGIIVAVVVSLLAIFAPSQQAQGNKLIASTLNGLFLIVLLAVGGRLGEQYYQKRSQILTKK